MAFSVDKMGQIVGGVSGGLSGIASAFTSNAQIANTTDIENDISYLNNKDLDYYDYDNLLNDYNNTKFFNTSLTGQDIRGISDAQKLFNTIGGAANGAMAGLQVAGPWGALGGAAIGGLSGIAGIFAGNAKADAKADELNRFAEIANKNYLAEFSTNAANINSRNFNKAAMNIAKNGGRLTRLPHISTPKYAGNMFAYGGQLQFTGSFSNGVTVVDEGGTHEENVYDGVQIGVDNNNVPNLVEEGEVIFNDYVYSNRLKPTETQLEDIKLNTKYKNKTYAEIAKDIQKESSERPNDMISLNGLQDGMSKLKVIQEETREKENDKKTTELFNQLSPEEQQMVASAAEQQIAADNQQVAPQQEVPLEGINPEQFAYGGKRGNVFDGSGYAPNFIGPIPASQYDRFIGPRQLNSEEQFIGPLEWPYAMSENGKYPYISTSNFSDIYASQHRPTMSFRQDNSEQFIGPTQRQYVPNVKVSASPWIDVWSNTHQPTMSFRQDSPEDRFIGPRFPQGGLVFYDEPASKPSGNKSSLSTNTKSERPALTNASRITSLPIDNLELSQTLPYKHSDLSLTKEEKNARRNDVKQYQEALEKEKNSNNSSDLSGLLRYAPALISGINAISSLFQRPDYTHANNVERTARAIRNVSYSPIGNYMEYVPMDVNYQRNQMRNANLGLQSNILNASSGNRGTAVANMLASNAQYTAQEGDLYRAALDYNNKMRNAVSEFNRGTNQYNSQMALNAAEANQRRDQAVLSGVYQASQMRDLVDTALSQSRSANLTNFANNLGGIGTDNFNANLAKWYAKNVAPDTEAVRSYRGASKGGKIKTKKCR